MRQTLALIVAFSAFGSRFSLAQPARSNANASAHDAAIEPLMLTPAEQALLREGEFSGAAHVGGIVAASTVGFGTGQLVQGRWLQRGWIFTVGEMAAGVLFAVAASENDLDTTLVNVLGFSGLAAVLGLHAWEIADAAIVPARHNRRVRFLRARAGLPTVSLDMRPVGDVHGGHRGALVGLRITF